MCIYNVGYYTDVYIKTCMFVDLIGSGDVCVFLAFLIIIMFDCCMCFKGISGIRFSLLPESSHRYRNQPQSSSGPAGLTLPSTRARRQDDVS